MRIEAEIVITGPPIVCMRIDSATHRLMRTSSMCTCVHLQPHTSYTSLAQQSQFSYTCVHVQPHVNDMLSHTLYMFSHACAETLFRVTSSSVHFVTCLCSVHFFTCLCSTSSSVHFSHACAGMLFRAASFSRAALPHASTAQCELPRARKQCPRKLSNLQPPQCPRAMTLVSHESDLFEPYGLIHQSDLFEHHGLIHHIF